MDWETLQYKFVEMNKEVDIRNPSGSSRAKTLWKMRDAKRRVPRPDQIAENRASGRGSPGSMEQALAEWEEAGSSTARREQKINLAWFFSSCVDW